MLKQNRNITKKRIDEWNIHAETHTHSQPPKSTHVSEHILLVEAHTQKLSSVDCRHTENNVDDDDDDGHLLLQYAIADGFKAKMGD